MRNYWEFPHTISYQIIPSKKATGWWVVRIFINGIQVSGRHLPGTRQEAIDIIKQDWKYYRKQPGTYAKKINPFLWESAVS